MTLLSSDNDTDSETSPEPVICSELVVSPGSSKMTNNKITIQKNSDPLGFDDCFYSNGTADVCKLNLTKSSPEHVICSDLVIASENTTKQKSSNPFGSDDCFCSNEIADADSLHLKTISSAVCEFGEINNTILPPVTRCAGKRLYLDFPYNFSIGEFVEVASNNIWCPGKILEVYSNREIKYKDGRKSLFSSGVVVSYIGWSSKFNEHIVDIDRVVIGGCHVFAYKAWIRLPNLPPWPCIVYDRGVVRNNEDAIHFLKNEFKVYIQVCGNNAKYLKPYFDGFWYDAKCISPFSRVFDLNTTSGKTLCKPDMEYNWRTAIGQLLTMVVDKNNYRVTDTDFEFDGTYLDRSWLYGRLHHA